MKAQKKTKDCFFKKITSAFAKRFPQYPPFVGMFLVTEFEPEERGPLLLLVVIIPITILIGGGVFSTPKKDGGSAKDRTAVS